MYNVRLKQFEGPLDLLLDLIDKEKLNITEISLAQVADQYLDYIERQEEINLANLADFLTVASKLILLKSKLLLPLLTVEEEEGEVVDLAQQIAEYKKFKDIAGRLEKILLRNKFSYSRETLAGVKPLFNPPKNVGSKDLKQTFEAILLQVPVMDKLEEERIKKVVSLREKIDNLKRTLREKVKISFSKLLKNQSGKKADKVETIVSFLAMLEMVKQKVVVVEQREMFYDIEITLREG